jgi:hypothetical protein
MKTLYLLLAMLAVTPMLAACSASCDCPKCPTHTTTVVTPPNSSTTSYPAE